MDENEIKQPVEYELKMSINEAEEVLAMTLRSGKSIGYEDKYDKAISTILYALHMERFYRKMMCNLMLDEMDKITVNLDNEDKNKGALYGIIQCQNIIRKYNKGENKNE